MLPSLPSYRRFAEATIQRINKARKRKSSDRPARMLFNVVLLAGLWGIPLYGRWMILTAMNPTQALTEAILGKWRIGKEGSWSFFEFTPKQLRLVGKKGEMIESADYDIAGDVLMLFAFKLQPGDHDLEIGQQCYQISIRGDQLTVTPSNAGFTPIDRHDWPECRLRGLLPRRQGETREFQRADNR